MAPLLVEGDTLGQKHRNYNNLVNEAIKNNPKPDITAINYEDSDLDNLFKIDLACNARNVDYILEVLKSADLLYVSRAIKQSTWLITDQQFAHIINCEYLHDQLYPKMTSKAFNKLFLHVRLHLKDEKRVEEFFDYYKKIDLNKALKWLPHCSIPFIENIIQKHADEISKQLLKRLCKKSSTFLQIFCRSYKSYYKREMLVSTMFILNKNTQHYLDLIETTEVGDIPRFGPKYTKKILAENHERIMQNLEKYVNFLDVSIFVKYLKKEEIKDFILTHIKNRKMHSWFTFKKIKYFLLRLPVEERFDFVNKLFIEREFKSEIFEDDVWDNIVLQCGLPTQRNESSSKNIYSWYICAPFGRAFGDLKQLIRIESNPTERISILRVILISAGKDTKNITTLLKYYRENHINEPFKFKIQFINYLLSKTDTYRYNKETWGYLNDIFNSMEVYSVSDKGVQSCVRAIIQYNAIRGIEIPDIITNKFVFETLKNDKLNEKEKDTVFNYLYTYLISKLKNSFENENEFNISVNTVENVLKLIDDWNKDLKDYPLILENINKLIIAKKENSWCRDLSGIYNFKKSWRKLFFAQSISLSPNQESCINALKHDPNLLEIYRKEINLLCLNESYKFNRFLKKLRIYWCQSLAHSFKTNYMANLDQKSNHKALIRGLCSLLSQKELLGFVQKYVPTEAKIEWSQYDEIKLSLCKSIATCMHLARPQPTPEVTLLYAKGDYLQYALPSLLSILHNVSSSYICEHVTQLLDTPVSLQKHGIRIAFSKLKYDQLKQIFTEIWKSTKNSSIRADIFNQTYKKLCKESDETAITEMWDLLSIFIDNLNLDENKNIYLNLSKTENVPLRVRAKFWMKSFEFLKKLPLKANFSRLIDDLRSQINDIMMFLDNDFVAKLFLENFDKMFTTKKYNYSYQVALFLLTTKTEEAQTERYEKVFLPILTNAITLWDKQHENTYYARQNLRQILDYMSEEFKNIVINKRMVFPIAMYTNMFNKLQSSLPIKENYILLTHTKLSLCYIKIVQDVLKENNELVIHTDTEEIVHDDSEEFSAKWSFLQTKVAPIFGRACLKYLRDDIVDHFSSIYIIFGNVLQDIITLYNRFSPIIELSILKVFLECKDFIEAHLLVLQLMPKFLYEDDEKALKMEILNEIRSHPSEEVAMHYWLLHK